MAPQRKSTSKSSRGNAASAGRRAAKPVASTRPKPPRRKTARPPKPAKAAKPATRSKAAKAAKPVQAAKPARRKAAAAAKPVKPATARPRARRAATTKAVTPGARTARRRGAALRTAEASVAASKFAALEAAASPEEASSIPQTYGRTRVRVLMQSPGRLFVHWDLSPGVLEEVKAQLGQRVASLARLAIRVTTPGVERPLLVMLPRGARSWYVDVPGQRFEYRAEIGLLIPSGEFRAVAQSNALRMPRTAPSSVAADRRVAVERGAPPAPGDIGDLPADEPAEEERLAAADFGFDGVAVDTEEVSPPGGSSELSGGRARRSRAAGRGQERPDLGGASDLAPAGSSSDLGPRK